MYPCLKYLIILIFGFFLTACGVTERFAQHNPPGISKSDDEIAHKKGQFKESPSKADSVSLPVAFHASGYSQIQSTLKKAYQKWKGAPYQWGGTTINGIDCSAFMQLLFHHYFKIDIPRTTDQQLYAGTKVSRQHLKPGDLIFFKTGRKTLHVGVVIEMPKFMHASTSQGVTISSLKDYYWRSRYITAKRVLN